jgi:hypothetical protein
METDNFAAVDLQNEHRRTLHAARVAATVIVLLAGVWAVLRFMGLQQGLIILENRVNGNLAMPPLVRWMVGGGVNFTVLAAAVALSCAAYVWVAGRSMSRIILATVIGAGLCAALALTMDFAFSQMMRVILVGMLPVPPGSSVRILLSA